MGGIGSGRKPTGKNKRLSKNKLPNPNKKKSLKQHLKTEKSNIGFLARRKLRMIWEKHTTDKR